MNEIDVATAQRAVPKATSAAEMGSSSSRRAKTL